jgi:subtilisin family serine protease
VDCDNLMTVGSPAASERAISVGSYNPRVVWTDFRGERHEVDEGLGELSSFSSRGPTRDGRVKPEITAPGQKIISARSNDRALCPYVHPLYCQAPELGWPDDVSYELLALQGTSMATPIVTGAAALLLQMDWRLDAEEIKGILMATARTDGSTGVRPDPDDWGAGKLDVRGAARRVEEMSAPTPVASPSPRPRASPSPSRSPGQRYGIFVPVAARGAIQ